jgi:hypothetical protein
MWKDDITKEILAILDEITIAFNAHIPDGILAHIHRSEQLRYVEHSQITIGWESLKNGFEKWHRTNRELTIRANQPYVNVLSYQTAVLVTAADVFKAGKKIQIMNWTAVFQKIEGSWKMVNAHETVSDA